MYPRSPISRGRVEYDDPIDPPSQPSLLNCYPLPRNYRKTGILCVQIRNHYNINTATMLLLEQLTGQQEESEVFELFGSEEPQPMEKPSIKSRLLSGLVA